MCFGPLVDLRLSTTQASTPTISLDNRRLAVAIGDINTIKNTGIYTELTFVYSVMLILYSLLVMIRLV